MIVRVLIENYISEKNDKPINVNQLLDFASLHYLNNKFTISEYYLLFHQLMLRGATKPDYHLEEKEAEKYKAIV